MRRTGEEDDGRGGEGEKERREGEGGEGQILFFEELPSFDFGLG